MLIAISLVLMAAAIAGVGLSGGSRWAIACAGVVAGVPAGASLAVPAPVLSPQSGGAGRGVSLPGDRPARAADVELRRSTPTRCL